MLIVIRILICILITEKQYSFYYWGLRSQDWTKQHSPSAALTCARSVSRWPYFGGSASPGPPQKRIRTTSLRSRPTKRQVVSVGSRSRPGSGPIYGALYQRLLIKNQPGKSILRPSYGAKKFRPDCLHVPSPSSNQATKQKLYCTNCLFIYFPAELGPEAPSNGSGSNTHCRTHLKLAPETDVEAFLWPCPGIGQENSNSKWRPSKSAVINEPSTAQMKINRPQFLHGLAQTLLSNRLSTRYVPEVWPEFVGATKWP